MKAEHPKFKIKKKKLGSYPFLSVIFSTTLALFVIGVFGALIIYSKEMERTVRETVNVQVYLHSHVTEAQKLQIQKTLSSRPFLPEGSIQQLIQFESKEQAAKKVIKDTGEDFQAFLGENPLKDMFKVRIAESYQNADSLKKIKADIEKISGVFHVFYVEPMIDSINKNITKISIVLLALAALLLLTVVLLINNTVRLALFSQRFLIRSMQLVGATRWFIQKPFLWRSVLHGLVAGVVASVLLVAVINFGNQRIEELQLIQNNERLVILMASLLVLGMLVALLSTYRAVRKYLQLSLDELY